MRDIPKALRLLADREFTSQYMSYKPTYDMLNKAANSIDELEARRLYLPKITTEITDTLDGSGLIEDGQWSQDAVEFVCILEAALEQP